MSNSNNNDLGTKVRSLNVSEIMEHIRPDIALDPKESIQHVLARQEKRAPGWRFRLQPDLDPSGYHVVQAVKDLAKIEFLLDADPNAGVMAYSAEVSFLEYPLRLSEMTRATLLSEIFDLRCEELSAWLRAQATRYKNQPDGA
jgi:hypothetical protein